MNQNVLVSITSLHSNGEHSDSIQSVVQGTYSCIQGKHVIRYEEILEETFDGEPPVTHCMLKIAKDSVSLTKRGQADTEMYFKKGEVYDGFYDTPLGSLQMSLRTTHLDITESEHAISIDLEYGLDFNYSHVSDCHMKMEITSHQP